MSKFFKSLLLLLSAGLFTATSWAAEPDVTGVIPWARYEFNGSDANTGDGGKTWNNGGGFSYTVTGARGDAGTNVSATGSRWTSQGNSDVLSSGLTVSVLATEGTRLAGGTDNNGHIFSMAQKGQGGTPRWWIRNSTSGTVKLQGLFTAALDVTNTTDPTGFHHYVVRISADRTKVDVFVDGIKIDTSALTVATNLDDTIYAYQLNGRWGGGTGPDAILDDVRIYDEALTDAQIAKLNVTLSKYACIAKERNLGVAIPENTIVSVFANIDEVTEEGATLNVNSVIKTANNADAETITWKLFVDENECGQVAKSFATGVYTLTTTVALPEGFELSEFTTAKAPVLAKPMTINAETALASQDATIVRTINGTKNIVAKLSASESSPTVYGGNPYGTVGTINGDVSISVTGGSYTAIFGGSNANNWGNGNTQYINGSVLVEMAGGESMYLFGGHYNDGNNSKTPKPGIRDDITVFVRDDAQITGSIIGAGVGAHNNTVNYGSENAPVDIRVKVENVQSENTNTAFSLAMKPGFIAGGGAYASNANSTQNVWGNTHVMITLADETQSSTFVKHIVGAGLLNSGGNSRNHPVMKVSGTSNVEISAPDVVTFSGKIIGGGYIDGTGAIPVGNSTVTINGGVFTNEIYAGCYVVNNSNAESKVSGIANLTINGGDLSRATVAPGAATTSKLVINEDVTIGTLQTFNEYEVADGVVLTVNTANLSGVTAPMTLVSGTGTLTIGQKRNVTYAGFGSGVVAVTVTADEIVDAKLQLPVTTAVTTAPEVARFALTSETGDTITPTVITLADNMLTITLPSMYVTVTESKSKWSEAVGESSGAVLVVGGATAEDAVEVTIDAEVSNAITEISITGYVKMATEEDVSFPANKVKFAEGAHLELDAAVQNGDWNISSGATLTLIGGEDESATTTLSNKVTVADGGTLETKGYLTLSGENKVIAGGSLKVLTGVTTLAAGDRAIKGTITINATAELVAASTDALDYDHESVINIYGTLNMSNKRWTVCDGNVFNLYADGSIIGAGENNRTALEVCENNTVNILANGDAKTVTISTPMRSRDNGDVIAFNVANGLTCTYSGRFDGDGKIKAAGAGVLKLTTQNANGGGAIVDAGATLVAANATALGTGAVTNSGTLELDAADVEATLAQVISGTGAINVKAGSWALTAANTGNKNVTIERDAMVDISAPSARLGYEGQASGNVVTVRGTLKVRDWNWNTENCLGKLDHSSERLLIDGGTIIFTENVSSARKATLSGDVTFEIEEGVVVTPTEKLTGNGNLTIDGPGTLALTASDSLTANSSATVTINANATLQAAGTGTTFYRTVLGEGKIVIPEGNFLAIGESDRDLTETASGLSNFEGTLEIAGTFDARSWGGREYTIGACNIDMQGGSIVKQYGDAAAAEIVIANGKTLSGTGTITIPVTLADGAIIDATTNAIVTANTLNALPANLTVKIANALEVGDTLNILTTTATPNTKATKVTVMVGDSDNAAEGTYSLVATGSALQLVCGEDAPVEPNVDKEVTADNTGIIELGDDNGGKYHGVQVNLDVATPYGPGWDAKRVYVLESISIADRSTSEKIPDGTTITVYDVTSGIATATRVGLEGSGTFVDRTPVTFTDKNASTVTTNWANFTFNKPILLDASKTYQFRLSDEASFYMIQVNNIAGATAEQKDAVIALNSTWGDPSPNFSPIVKLTATRKAVPNVSYVPDANVVSARETNTATLGDWAVTSSANFKTDGLLGIVGEKTVLTPDSNVGNGYPWTMTLTRGDAIVMDAVTINVQMATSTGSVHNDSHTRTVILSILDENDALLGSSGTVTFSENDRVTDNQNVTINLDKPHKLSTLKLKAEKGDPSTGSYFGISSFNVGTYEGATAVAEGNITVEKGNVSNKNTSPMTKTDDSVWSVVSCKQLSTNADLGMKTGGAVGDDLTIITPNVNVSSATSAEEGWALRYEADAPRKVDSVTVTIQMFNGGGNIQNADNYTRAFKMTLKDVNGNELATTEDRTLQAVKDGTSRYPITLQIEEPTELDTIVVEVSKGTAEQGASGCFYGVSSFEVQLSQETTVLVNPTAWPSADMKLGAVYVGAEANLPAAPATQGGIYKADVFRSLNDATLTEWTITAATETQTMMTFTQNASGTLTSPAVPEALRPGAQAMSVHFDDTPYFGELGVKYMPFTTATDVAILYVDSDDEIAYNSNAWWTSATEGAVATQGALGDKTPVLWLEGGKITMADGADAKPLTFHNETTNGRIAIPAGVALAYGVTGEPSVSSPSIPRDVVVELGGALTMAGTLESVKLIGTGATLSGVNADNGDLTVTSIDTTAGTDLTIAGGNVMLTNPPETLSVNLNGGNIAVTASADTTATLAKLTVTQNANLTGDISVAQLGGTATLTSADTMTVTGATTFSGSLNGVNLVVADTADLTLSGTSTISTIDGTGSLTVQKALTLTSPSTFDGTLSVGDATSTATLTCNASLTIQKTLQFLSTRANLKTTGDVWVTIASGATIIPNLAWHAANMDIAAGATIDLSVIDGELRLEAVKLPAGAGQGAVTVKGSRTSTIIDTESPLPEGLLVSNFCLAEDDNTLYFLVDYSEDRVALVKVNADLSERTEEERQDILLLAFMMGGFTIGEIENPDVALLFDGKYRKAYGFEHVPVYDEDETLIALNLRYFVKFGISDISNVRMADGSLLANVTAVVEPLEEGESVSFKDGVFVALYVNDTPLKEVKIEKDAADIRQVVFDDVQLPEFTNGTGTHELTVRVQSTSALPQ